MSLGLFSKLHNRVGVVSLYVHVRVDIISLFLSLSLSENCLDRHAEENADKPAFIWEKDEPGTHEIVTYG